MSKSALVPATVAAFAALVGGAWYKKHKSLHGKMTPERERMYEQALKEVRNPAKLRALAKEYRKNGLSEAATMLEKRAGLKELPTAVKEQRSAVVSKLLSSKDKDVVRTMAASFEGEGAVGMAARLRAYADTLENHGDFQSPKPQECDVEPSNAPST